MKKTLKILLFLLSLYSVKAYAQFTPYTTLVDSLPGVGKSVSFVDYIPAIFNLSVGIGAGLAFVMITLGGITYATSDAITGKSQGKEMITNALYGLLLIIGAYAILYTIDPNMLSLKLTIPRPAIYGLSPSGQLVAGTNNIGGNIWGVPMNDMQIAADQEVRALMTNWVTAKEPCLNGIPVNCTDLNGLNPSIITQLNKLSAVCGCAINITGGTEPGHDSNSVHNLGQAVDITSDAIAKIIVKSPDILKACNTYSYEGGRFLWEPKGESCGGEVTSSGNHWHVTY